MSYLSASKALRFPCCLSPPAGRWQARSGKGGQRHVWRSIARLAPSTCNGLHGNTNDISGERDGGQGISVCDQTSVRQTRIMSIEKVLARIPVMTREGRANLRRNAERWLAQGTPGQRMDAQRVISALNEFEAEIRQPPPPDASPERRTERVLFAFRELPPTTTEQKVIAALLDHPASNTTLLSQVCGWRGHEPWYLHFGKACRAREVYLWPAKYVEEWNDKFYSGILADFDYNGSRFTMKPEAVRAFSELRTSWKS